MSEPMELWPNPIAPQSRHILAQRLGLRDENSMQDWALEVADAGRTSEFLEALENTAELESEVRDALMQVIVASYDEMLDQGLEVSPGLEDRLVGHLASGWPRWEGLVRYWAHGTHEDGFLARPLMLRVLARVTP